MFRVYNFLDLLCATFIQQSLVMDVLRKWHEICLHGHVSDCQIMCYIVSRIASL